MKHIILYTALFFGCSCFGQDLVYRAKNPAFGGDTFNYQWLQGSADAQNTFKDPDEADDDQSQLDAFSESLNRRLLDRIANELLNSQFGDDLLEPGTSSFGDLELEIFESSEGLVINILNTTNGDQTQIIVPN
jgi:curli production assembly/transport component CsgF